MFFLYLNKLKRNILTAISWTLEYSYFKISDLDAKFHDFFKELNFQGSVSILKSQVWQNQYMFNLTDFKLTLLLDVKWMLFQIHSIGILRLFTSVWHICVAFVHQYTVGHNFGYIFFLASTTNYPLSKAILYFIQFFFHEAEFNTFG